ncbi:alpha-2-macroglobulin-like isoform X1, partial [Paramuricea clavata]
LTAFVVRSFARARKHVFVDEDEIKHSIQWFRRKQKLSGCFPKYGKVFHKSLQGGLNSELTITAYVTIALLEAGFDKKTRIVSKALNCVTDKLTHIQDSYTTSLVTYTLVLADHPKAGLMISRLKDKAVSSEDGQIFWSARNDKLVATEEPTDYFVYQPHPADVEMTGYALMSYLKRKELLKDVIKIVKWLSKQRNDYGGFSSTQDTCIALQALSEVAQKVYTKDGRTNLAVSANIKDIFTQDFTVTGSNKLVLQRAEIPSKLLPNTLAISASGNGCALLQTSVKYNIPAPDEIPAFKVAVSVHRREASDEEEIAACYPLQLKIGAKWLKENVSNMAIVDVKLVSGFSVNEKTLQQKLKQPEIAIEFFARNNEESEAILKRYEIDGQNVILYFDELKTMNFSLDIIQSTLVKKTKPGVVKVYDYYDPESQAKVMYKITEKDCYGERIENECPKCLSVDDFEDLFDKNINCTSYLTRVKSIGGLLTVKKAYIKANYSQEYATVPYTIPEFCLCDEINNGVTSLVFGQSDYFRKNGEDISLVFDSGTTIAKWNGEKMRNIFREKMVQEIYQKCWRFFEG